MIYDSIDQRELCFRQLKEICNLIENKENEFSFEVEATSALKQDEIKLYRICALKTKEKQ